MQQWCENGSPKAKIFLLGKPGINLFLMSTVKVWLSVQQVVPGDPGLLWLLTCCNTVYNNVIYMCIYDESGRKVYV